MPFGIQPIHLVVIAVVALLIFGPSRLPEIGRGVGRALTEFRRSAKEMGGSFIEEVNQPLETPAGSQPIPGNSATPAAPGEVKAPEGNAIPSHFCIHCGKANPAGAIFCNQCGQKVTE